MTERRCNMTFLAMWHSCHWHQHYLMPLVLVSLDASGIHVSITGCLKCHIWPHCIPWVKMMEMRFNITFMSWMPLALVTALAQCSTISVGVIWFKWHYCIPEVQRIKMRCSMIFCHVMLTVLAMTPLSCLGQEDQNVEQHDLFGYVMP